MYTGYILGSINLLRNCFIVVRGTFAAQTCYMTIVRFMTYLLKYCNLTHGLISNLTI